jgi:hypothetical protein
MLLSKETQDLLGLTEATYLEFHHQYADNYDIAQVMALAKEPKASEGFDPKAKPGARSRKPYATVVALVQGDLKSKNPKVIDQAESRCHPKDQFSREKGRKYAMEKLLFKLKPGIVASNRPEDFVYSKAQRTAIWNDYFKRKDVVAEAAPAAKA